MFGLAYFLGVIGVVSAFCIWLGFYVLGFKQQKRSWFWFIFISGTLAFTFALFSAGNMLNVMTAPIAAYTPSPDFFAKTIVPSTGLIIWLTVVTYMILQRFDFTKSSARSA
jgi:hypothetical protein